MKKRNIVLIILIIILIGFAGYMIYNSFKSANVSYNAGVIKEYISIYFKDSRIIFPLKLFTNSTG